MLRGNRYFTPMDKPCRLAALSLLLALMLPRPAAASTLPDDPKALLSLSIEHLSEMVVTTVGKRERRYQEAAAALTVLTAEDIHRSGLATLPEVLRLVPGLQVARAQNHGWVVTARGAASQFSNKMLVLMDGRMLYSPLFAGVYWDVQDPLLEDIERIEVIRGPGATVWGANALNGVINIITKQASETQGSLVKLATGTEERGSAAYRHGVKLGENRHLRVTTKLNQRRQGEDFDDKQRLRQLQFRLDDQSAKHRDYSLQGQLYSSEAEYTAALPDIAAAGFQSLRPDTEQSSGGYLLGHWRQEENYGDWNLTGYWDHSQRERFTLAQRQDIGNLDAELQLDPLGRHSWVMGIGARVTQDELAGTPYISFSPEERTDWLWSAFLQDDITLQPKRWALTLGSKFEANNYSGFEWQPSTQLRWTPDAEQTWWASLSHAIRSPARAIDDITYIAGVSPTGPAYTQLLGSRDIESENMNALELGWRYLPKADWSLDVALYYQSYNDLVTLRQESIGAATDPFFAPALMVTNRPFNGGDGSSYGGEAAASWQVRPDWLLKGSYSYLQQDLPVNNLIGDENGSPKHQWQLQSRWNIADGWAFDQWLAYTDELDGQVEGHLRLDLRLGWQPLPGLELSLVGQNLLDDSHPEFEPFLYTAGSEIARSVYGQMVWRF